MRKTPTQRADEATKLTIELRSQPGLDITKQVKGTVIMAETKYAVYEITVLEPEAGLVTVNSSDAHLHSAPIGQFKQSNYGVNGEVVIPNWITKKMRMEIQFKNGLFQTSPVLTLNVKGDGWNYEL